MATAHFTELSLANAAAEALQGRGYRRRTAAPAGGELRVIKSPGGFDLEWEPLSWDVEMLRRLRALECHGSVFDLIETAGGLQEVLRLLSSLFPDREAALAALNNLERLASKEKGLDIEPRPV
jgi:hypothetical protein